MRSPMCIATIASIKIRLKKRRDIEKEADVEFTPHSDPLSRKLLADLICCNVYVTILTYYVFVSM